MLRNLEGDKIKRQIPRGYGTFQGKLQNAAKVKILGGKRSYISNRMLCNIDKIVSLYKKRWTIE